jgi:hypothetical protein
MSATKGTEQDQDSGYQNFRLDERYGKIGISAVAAAVCHKGEQRKVRKQRRTDFVYDCD